MIRKIITIDADKCNGCGACVSACHEGAIGMRDGKAVLLRDDYCDGLGDCLPACPTDAIAFVEREAMPYDEEAVLANMRRKGVQGPPSCPGTHARDLSRGCPGSRPALSPLGTGGGARPGLGPAHGGPAGGTGNDGFLASRLRQWPVQIQLAPVDAPWFTGADVLIAADCTAFAHGAFHPAFMQGKVTLIGCPKLDEGDYSVKLAAIFTRNDIRSVTVARMSVPCCGGMERAARTALEQSGRDIPFAVVTITPEGAVLP